jgi:sigma-E factor negative regulatory protein RseB
LLLQWQLNDPQGDAVAKLVFTELKMGSEVDESELKNYNGNLQKVKSGLPAGLPEGASASTAAGAEWQAHWMPPGFRMTANPALKQSSEDHFQHQVYSDGIASISLYVEPLNGSAGAGSGLQELGTSHIFSIEIQDAVVTVVGDVPAITVEKIAYSVARNLP